MSAERQTGGSTPSNVNTRSSVKRTGSAIHRYLWRSTLKSLSLTGIFLLSVLGRLAGSTIGAFTCSSFCLSDCFKLRDQKVPFIDKSINLMYLIGTVHLHGEISIRLRVNITAPTVVNVLRFQIQIQISKTPHLVNSTSIFFPGDDVCQVQAHRHYR